MKPTRKKQLVPDKVGWWLYNIGFKQIAAKVEFHNGELVFQVHPQFTAEKVIDDGNWLGECPPRSEQ